MNLVPIRSRLLYILVESKLLAYQPICWGSRFLHLQKPTSARSLQIFNSIHILIASLVEYYELPLSL
jgi:hypothetical protein